MREILFRGKRKYNGKWIEGYYCPCCFGRFPCRPAIISKEDMDNGYWHPEEVIPEIVEQYTGLTDKNGKKIFEGDIVHLTDYYNDWYAVVVFGNPYSEYSWGWNFEYIGKIPRCNTDILLWVEMEEGGVYCEIIGNIHDNPELLKGGAGRCQDDT